MGHNRAIKQYEPRTTGQPLDLFTESDTRAPVVLELLRSPWIVRGSELSGGVSGFAGKRRECRIEVVWDASRGMPRSFSTKGRTYAIDAVVQSWAVERAWWDPRTRLSRRCYRVLARGGLYDLAYDLIADRWLLTGIVD